MSAAKRGSQRIQASVARTGLVELLVPLAGSSMNETITAWAAALTDDGVCERVDRLVRARRSSRDALRVAEELVAEAHAYEACRDESEMGDGSGKTVLPDPPPG